MVIGYLFVISIYLQTDYTMPDVVSFYPSAVKIVGIFIENQQRW